MAINHAALAADLGKVFGGIKEMNTWRGTTLAARVATLRTEYGTDPNELLADLTDEQVALRDGMSGWADYLATVAENTVIETVVDDRTPAYDDIDEAFDEWARQLRNDGVTFNDCPATLTWTAPATGAPAIVGDITFHTSDMDVDGKKTDFPIPDRYLITVSADADNGGTRWAETLAIVSKAGDNSVLDAAYPTGSDINTTFNVIDPATNSGELTDGGFDTYTAAAFTYWTRLTGNTATQVFRGADDVRDGASGFCLQLKSNGTNVTGVKQTIEVTANTVYTLHFAVKGVNNVEATAKIYVGLWNNTTGTLLQDDQGVNLVKTSAALSVVGTTNWIHYTATFATPKRLPIDGVYLDVRVANGTTISTAATNLTEVRVDHVVLIESEPLYDKGVRIDAFSGDVEPGRTDQWEYTVALTSGAVSDYFVRWLDRTIGLADRVTKLPTTTGSPTIDDSVIS